MRRARASVGRSATWPPLGLGERRRDRRVGQCRERRLQPPPEHRQLGLAELLERQVGQGRQARWPSASGRSRLAVVVRCRGHRRRQRRPRQTVPGRGLGARLRHREVRVGRARRRACTAPRDWVDLEGRVPEHRGEDLVEGRELGPTPHQRDPSRPVERRHRVRRETASARVKSSIPVSPTGTPLLPQPHGERRPRTPPGRPRAAARPAARRSASEDIDHDRHHRRRRPPPAAGAWPSTRRRGSSGPAAPGKRQGPRAARLRAQQRRPQVPRSRSRRVDAASAVGSGLRYVGRQPLLQALRRTGPSSFADTSLIMPLPNWAILPEIFRSVSTVTTVRVAVGAQLRGDQRGRVARPTGSPCPWRRSPRDARRRPSRRTWRCRRTPRRPGRP